MDGDEVKAIWYVLRELLIDGERMNLGRIPDGAHLDRIFTPLSEFTLEQRMRHGPRREFELGEGIRLKPPYRDAQVAALSCKCRFDGSRTTWRFYLGLWLGGDRFVGIRFEPPGDAENHSYYHSQLCSTMGDRAPVAGALEVPERYPAWPLPAASSLELLLCLVVSVHGMAGFNELRGRIKEDSAMRQNDLLVKALDKMAGLPTARVVRP